MLVSDEQLACIDRAASYYKTELRPSIQPRFDAIRNARIAARLKTEAREWLENRKLLERLPSYKLGVTDDVTFTREIEGLCGPEAAGAFQGQFGFHTFDPEWGSRLKFGENDNNGLACLLNVAWATDFPIGFVGNEMVAP